jgi:hypothetical protein
LRAIVEGSAAADDLINRIPAGGQRSCVDTGESTGSGDAIACKGKAEVVNRIRRRERRNCKRRCLGKQ